MKPERSNVEPKQKTATQEQPILVSLRLPPAELRDIDAICSDFRRRTGAAVTRTATIRDLIRKGIAETVRQERASLSGSLR